jgi:hypothetical protein
MYQGISRSRRAATLLYEATRTTTCQPSGSGAMPCYARVRGGRCGGDPSMACKAQGLKSPQLHQAQCIGRSPALGRLSADCQQITNSGCCNTVSADQLECLIRAMSACAIRHATKCRRRVARSSPCCPSPNVRSVGWFRKMFRRPLRRLVLQPEIVTLLVRGASVATPPPPAARPRPHRR